VYAVCAGVHSMVLASYFAGRCVVFWEVWLFTICVYEINVFERALLPLSELAKKFHWNDEAVARLRRLHERFQDVRRAYCKTGEPDA